MRPVTYVNNAWLAGLLPLVMRSVPMSMYIVSQTPQCLCAAELACDIVQLRTTSTDSGGKYFFINHSRRFVIDACESTSVAGQ